MACSDMRIIHNITKGYPDMVKVILYKEPKVFIVRAGIVKRDKEDVLDDGTYAPAISSLYRTKTLVQDIVLCNDFELFCTFTFDPKKVNRFSYAACKCKMSCWLAHQRDNARECGKEFRYLIVPEQHKSGAWHFHALISGYTGSLHDSGLKSSSNRPIYNITSFRSGFTTAVAIDSVDGVASYVTKYITKGFIKMFNRRRFLCSRNLRRPTRELNSPVFRNSLPLFRKKVSENLETEQYLLPIFNDYPTNIRTNSRTRWYDLPLPEKYTK